MLQREMSSLKAMMEKLQEQSCERVRQFDTAPTTSSFAVQSSNTLYQTRSDGFYRSSDVFIPQYYSKKDADLEKQNSSIGVRPVVMRKLSFFNKNLLFEHIYTFGGICTFLQQVLMRNWARAGRLIKVVHQRY